MKFKGHKYEYTKFFGPRHQWQLRGPEGAIHFHVSISSNPKTWGDSAGLEFHHAVDPSNGKTAPDHIDCPMVGGRCWHDGTSLYASETLWPMVKPMLANGDHDAIFKVLEHEYVDHFRRHQDDDREGAA